MKINLPLGLENFAELIENGCYYIDKTGFIKELLDETFKVNLITRPRRFGKTLTMSMLEEFFDIQKDSRSIFRGLEISQDARLCDAWQNRWPVLFLTLKDVEGNTFWDAYEMLKYVIANLCKKHSYLAKSESADEDDRRIFLSLKSCARDNAQVRCALQTMMRMMAAHFGKPVILLIDEYDVPLAKASDYGYYEEMLQVVRSLLGMAWKTNPFLKFAVVTGCLRIAKESIFTGANNFISRSISGRFYSRYFGFLEEEVKELLNAAGLPAHYDRMKEWYDGYLFGGQEVFCPWDVLNYLSELSADPDSAPGNYWKSTSHNRIIRRFIDMERIAAKDKFETLLAGGTIQVTVAEDMTYDFDDSAEDNLWSILYLAGYLTQAPIKGQTKNMGAKEGQTALRIPNEEVKTIFADTVAKWFTDTVETKDRSRFFAAWWEGKDEELTREVTDILFDTISYFDYREDYYHAFTAGLFAGAGYEVLSNSEQGTGRADIIVKDRRNRRALVIETKRYRTEHALAGDCEKALQQIKQNSYAVNLLKGYEKVFCYGAAFFEKQCRIKLLSKQETKR